MCSAASLCVWLAMECQFQQTGHGGKGENGRVCARVTRVCVKYVCARWLGGSSTHLHQQHSIDAAIVFRVVGNLRIFTYEHASARRHRQHQSSQLYSTIPVQALHDLACTQIMYNSMRGLVQARTQLDYGRDW